MKDLRKRFNRFCLRNRNKGIPNLMLYIVLGCGVVSALTLLGFSELYQLLCFDKELILQGQVWRLVTYIFTIYSGNILTLLLVLYCAYSLGRTVEDALGTFKFNLYYLVGIVVMDAFAMLFDGNAWVLDFASGQFQQLPVSIPGYYAAYMPMFLHLSLVLCFATLYPETRFLLFYIIPIKAKFLSLIYLGFALFEMIQYTIPVALIPQNLFPLVALLNYFLFFGKDVRNLLPLSWQVKRKKVKRPVAQPGNGPIQFRAKSNEKPDYAHRCVVCGRTDVSNPELEFRYCSRCSGYRCYCQDHINDHAHITE